MEHFPPTLLYVSRHATRYIRQGPSDLATAAPVSTRETSFNNMISFSKPLKKNIQKRDKGKLSGGLRLPTATLLGPQPYTTRGENHSSGLFQAKSVVLLGICTFCPICIIKIHLSAHLAA